MISDSAKWRPTVIARRLRWALLERRSDGAQLVQNIVGSGDHHVDLQVPAPQLTRDEEHDNRNDDANACSAKLCCGTVGHGSPLAVAEATATMTDIQFGDA